MNLQSQDNNKTNECYSNSNSTAISSDTTNSDTIVSNNKSVKINLLANNYNYPPEFIQQLHTIVESNKLQDIEGAFLLLSIDNLAMIISGFGHDISEDILSSMERTITQILSPNDIIERIQRDQYGIILSSANAEETEYIANRISSLIQHFGSDSCHDSLHLLSSISEVSLLTEDKNAAQHILDEAYINIKKPRIYTPNMMDEGILEASMCRHEMELANYLTRAIKENRLKLAYQAVINSKTGEAEYYEALLRVIGEDGDIASAGALIPIAERMGLINVIDNLVLEMVVSELRRSSKVTIAMNISNLTTKNKKWLQILKRLITETPEIAEQLMIEITETAVHSDLAKTADFVANLQACGVKVALDDFGSGYTSFRQLKTLSLDVVKIDGSFIRDLTDSADNRFFVQTLMEYTKSFRLKTVAEFVENGEIAKMLMDLGVDYMQGYYFAKPECRRPWLDEG